MLGSDSRKVYSGPEDEPQLLGPPMQPQMVTAPWLFWTVWPQAELMVWYWGQASGIMLPAFVPPLAGIARNPLSCYPIWGTGQS